MDVGPALGWQALALNGLLLLKLYYYNLALCNMSMGMCFKRLDYEGLDSRSRLLNVNTFKYHVFAPMGRFQLELFYLYLPLFEVQHPQDLLKMFL